MRNEIKKLIKVLWIFFEPIAYLLIWILLIKLAKSLGLSIDGTFLLISLIILFFGIISKSTAWSIGHEKFGIKGDSTSKKIEFCADGVGTIKIFDDDLNTKKQLMTEATKVIKELKK